MPTCTCVDGVKSAGLYDPQCAQHKELAAMQGALCEARAELERWRNTAFYLADCHRATAAYDGMLRTTSKSRRERLASICSSASRLLQGEHPRKQYTDEARFGQTRTSEIIDQLERAAARLRE